MRTTVNADVATLRSAIETLSRLLCAADGAATITIPVTEHRRLLECERLSNRRMVLPPATVFTRFRIDRDEDVALFIAERAGRLTLAEIVAECERCFGRARTPGLTTVWRFIHRLTPVQDTFEAVSKRPQKIT